MPTQTEVDNFNASLRGDRDTADNLYPEFDAEIRVYQTGQVEYQFRRAVRPGEDAGTWDTASEPDTPTAADYRIRDDAASVVAEDMRAFGAEVETFARGDTAEVYATFSP